MDTFVEFSVCCTAECWRHDQNLKKQADGARPLYKHPRHRTAILDVKSSESSSPSFGCIMIHEDIETSSIYISRACSVWSESNVHALKIHTFVALSFCDWTFHCVRAVCIRMNLKPPSFVQHPTHRAAEPQDATINIPAHLLLVVFKNFALALTNCKFPQSEHEEHCST